MNSREVMLREIGLTPIWQARGVPGAVGDSTATKIAASEADIAVTITEPAVTAVATPAAVPETPSAELPVDGAAGQLAHHDRAATIANMSWDELTASIAKCTACKLCKTRTRTVPGVGDRSPLWMVIGEAPGEQEDKRGEPFVGKAGQLLDAMLAAVGKKRGDGVYIANVIKCRPPGNRNPEPDEIAACEPYLRRQIALAQPKLLLAAGKFSAQTLLNREDTVGAMRASGGNYESIPVVVTYHPSYLLRTPTEKAKAWDDLMKACTLVP